MTTAIEHKKEIVQYLIERDVLVTPEILYRIDDSTNKEAIYNELQNGKKIGNVNVLFSYEKEPTKRTVQDFVAYFNQRYKALERILHSRQELRGLTSIARINQKKDRELVSIIGMVEDKQNTKNDNIILTIEDPTDTIKVIITKENEHFATAKDIVYDEVIGVVGYSGNGIIFANNIILPDIPITQETKKSEDEAYFALISDVHVGSSNFLEEEYKNFIQWTRGEYGTDEQRRIARKLHYIFIVGDLVDGVGIYPGMEADLNISDIYTQCNKFVELTQHIPSHIRVIICPGNHDPVRLSEPQPKLPNRFSKVLEKLPNTTFVSNPALINIHHSEQFSGFKVLLYHGYSYDHYGDVVESIRTSGKHMSDRTSAIMQFLLRRRHVAPSQTSTLYIPDPQQDPLVITEVPDFFLSGHIHKSTIANYRGVTIISGSCWQSKTSFQEKVGHEPDPCKVPIINLQTRKITILDFSKINTPTP